MINGTFPALDFVNVWMAAMGRASLEGAVAIGLVWIVCRSVRRLSPNVRCWLWRLALLKMVLAAVPLGSVNVPILPHAWANWHTAGAIIQPDLAVPAEVSSMAAPALASSTKANVLKGNNTRIGFVVLFAVWLVVLTGFLGAVVVRACGARRWRKHWRLIKDRDILTLSERVAGALRLFQPPVLFEAENCQSPVVFGAVRPAVVLPSRLVAQSTPSQLRLILAHEMAHIRRGDLLGNWFSTFVSGLFFFHPFVWLALRESRLSQEVACDELAVQQPDVSVADYGCLLVELATRCPVSTRPVVTVGVVESFNIHLKRRLSAMKTFGTSSRKVFVLSWFVVVIAVFGLLPWRLVAQTKSAAENITKVETPKTGATTPVAADSAALERIKEKLNKIILPDVELRDAPIADVLNLFNKESRRLDKPTKEGVNFVLQTDRLGGTNPPARTVSLNLHNIPLIEAVRYATSGAGLQFRIEPNAVLVGAGLAQVGEMVTRSYTVAGKPFRTVGQPAKTGGGDSTATLIDVKKHFQDAGVPFPPGSSLVYSERLGRIIIRNTTENLEIFERVCAGENDVVPTNK